MATIVVNIRHEPCDQYIGRPWRTTLCHFGNPFTFMAGTKAHTVLDSREMCIAAFAQWLDGTAYQDVEPDRRQWILDNIEQLRDRRLGCFCKRPGKDIPCHGDVYVKILNGRDGDGYN